MTTELDIARQAEAAIGRRPLTGAEKQALFSTWSSIHGPGFDGPKNLRALEREAAHKVATARVESDRHTRERRAEEQRQHAIQTAVREAAVRSANDIRDKLPALLPYRDLSLTVAGPGEVAPEPSDETPLVIAVAPSNLDRPSAGGAATAVLRIEVRGREQDLVEYLLKPSRKADAPLLEAMGLTPLFVRHLETIDRRDFGTQVDTATGQHRYGQRSGWYGMVISARVWCRDPFPAENKPAVGPTEPVRWSGVTEVDGRLRVVGN